MNKILSLLSLSILLFMLASCSVGSDVERLPSRSVGNLIVDTPDEQKKELTEQEKVFYLQQKERDRQQKDIEDLERQRFYNEKIKNYGLE
ncbi:MAG: hypothetical protein ACOX3T_06015 [Bdellovibrionota bacterium]